VTMRATFPKYKQRSAEAYASCRGAWRLHRARTVHYARTVLPLTTPFPPTA